MRNNIRVLLRSKILCLFLALTSAFVIIEIASIYGKPISVTEPLGNAMTLSIYLFISMTFLSYEYLRKFYNHGVSEVFLSLQSKRENVVSAFLLLSIYAMLLSTIIAVLVIVEFLFYKIQDPHHEYIFHTLGNVFLNDYMIMRLGIFIGGSLAIMKNRIVTYSIMTLFTIAVSPFATSMAYLIDAASLDKKARVGMAAFKSISLFYILPRFDLKWMPRAEFGESLLPYRFFIIGFWSFLFVTVLLITRRYKKRKIVVSSFLCAAMLLGYLYPSSRMEQTFDAYRNGVPDSVYCSSGEYKEKIQKADYTIKEYDMDLSIRQNLSATMVMKVSKSLAEYHMTLYRKYKVLGVKDQDGNGLEYEQKGDYITVFNREKRKINEISMTYRGSSADCYANYQGCYLPGYYMYYPRAGYMRVYDVNYGMIVPNFVDENTKFKVRVSPGGKYISNLPKVDGVYVGTCDGFTLLKGFYKEQKLNDGNVMVYPYLDNFVLHDGKKKEALCWKENFDFSSEQLKKDGISNTMIFMDLGTLDGEFLKAYGKNQIFVNAGGSFYYSDQ